MYYKLIDKESGIAHYLAKCSGKSVLILFGLLDGKWVERDITWVNPDWDHWVENRWIRKRISKAELFAEVL